MRLADPSEMSSVCTALYLRCLFFIVISEGKYFTNQFPVVSSTPFICRPRLKIMARVEKSQFCTFLGKLCYCQFFILDLIFTRLYKVITSKLLFTEKRMYFWMIIYIDFTLESVAFWVIEIEVVIDFYKTSGKLRTRACFLIITVMPIFNSSGDSSCVKALF